MYDLKSDTLTTNMQQNIVTIQEANLADAALIADLGQRIWWPTYSSILTADQISYMLDTIYSVDALTKVMQA
ncbi:MAG TPA: hypothetical protein VFW11_10160, partial [Cyclobacteriaceae bacterium]|nr:hypothetical protein [Cyclobacteriaceae bacterium]